VPRLPERRDAVVKVCVDARVCARGVHEILLLHAVTQAFRPAVELQLEPVEVRVDILVHAEVDQCQPLGLVRPDRVRGRVPALDVDVGRR
jgi:hypothetical protein